jgi:hypothetical protein
MCKILHFPLKILVIVRKEGKYNQIFKAFCRNHYHGQVLPELKLSLRKHGLTYKVFLRLFKEGIATGYGLDGPRIEYRWEPDFSHTSRPALGPTQPPMQRVPGLTRGKSGRGVVLTTHPLLAPRSRKGISVHLPPPLNPLGRRVCYGVPLPLLKTVLALEIVHNCV